MHSKLNCGEKITLLVTFSLLIAMEIDKGIGKGKEALIGILVMRNKGK